MDQKKIGVFLKELRKEKGITQEEFAENLNVSGRTVSRWETGTNMPDISVLVDIATRMNSHIIPYGNKTRNIRQGTDVTKIANNRVVPHSSFDTKGDIIT